jgi:hypothetical protein
VRLSHNPILWQQPTQVGSLFLEFRIRLERTLPLCGTATVLRLFQERAPGEGSGRAFFRFFACIGTMNLVAANVNWRTGRALATSAASQRAATVAGAWAGGTGFENLTRTPKLNFCIGEVRPSRSQPGRVGGRLENVPWLEGSQWLRPRTGALRPDLVRPATSGSFGVRV